MSIVLLVAIAATLYFYADTFKPRLEAAASAALGLDVEIVGHVQIGLLPGLRATLGGVRIRNADSDIASAEEVRLWIGLLPLIRGRVQISDAALTGVEISIERDKHGAFNFARAAGPDAASSALAVAHVAVSGGTLRYTNRQTDYGYVAEDCHLRINDLRFASGNLSNPMKNLSFSAEGACQQIPKQEFAVTEVTFAVAGRDAIFEAAPVTMTLFGARGSGHVHADFSAAVPRYRVEFALPQFQVDQLFRTVSPRDIATGQLNFAMEVSTQGWSMREIRQNATGKFAIGGENIRFSGRDLDKEFSRFETSQNFNLVDAGALFFAGPFGLVVTKGYTFAGVLQGSGGSSDITTMVSEWQVKRGVAHARDVAMATKQNRIAVHGDLDLVDEQFDDVVIALIDANGCAKAQQRIDGPFEKPAVEIPAMLGSIAGSAVNLYKQAEALLGGTCEVFYAGRVAAPN